MITFTKKELKYLDKIIPDNEFMISTEGRKAANKGYNLALKQSKE